jgi:hypothetical protein
MRWDLNIHESDKRRMVGRSEREMAGGGKLKRD